MSKKEDSGILWVLIGIPVLVYTLFQLIDTIIDEVFRKSYFKNLNFNESLIYVFFFVIFFDVLFFIFLGFLYFRRFPNSKIFSNYFSTLISVFVASVIQTFFIDKIFNADLSIILFAVIINLIFQYYFSFGNIEEKSEQLEKDLNINRSLLFKNAIKYFPKSSKLSVNHYEITDNGYFLLKLTNCNLTVYNNSNNLIFKCFRKNLTAEEIREIRDIDPHWELSIDLKKYGIAVDNFIKLLDDEYNLSKINTKSEYSLTEFLLKDYNNE